MQEFMVISNEHECHSCGEFFNGNKKFAWELLIQSFQPGQNKQTCLMAAGGASIKELTGNFFHGVLKERLKSFLADLFLNWLGQSIWAFSFFLFRSTITHAHVISRFIFFGPLATERKCFREILVGNSESGDKKLSPCSLGLEAAKKGWQ